MAPIPEPNATAERCSNCGAPLPEPKPALCPNCGASLYQRPVWLSVIAGLGAAVLGLAALCLGGFGACVALFAGAEGGSLFSSDALWIWGCLLGAVLCAVAAGFIIRWLIKKPKP